MQLNQQQLQAVEEYLASLPPDKQAEQRAVIANSFGGDVGAWADSFVGWWQENIDKVDPAGYAPELSLLNSFGMQAVETNADGTETAVGATTVPAEQYLGTQVLTRAVDDMNGDAARKAEAERRVAEINAAYQNTLDLNARLLPGANGGPSQRLQDENQMVTDTHRRIEDAIDAQTNRSMGALDQRLTTQLASSAELTAAQKAALGDLTTSEKAALADEISKLRTASGELDAARLAALDPVTKARLAAADAQTRVINQGLESERDRQVAEAATQGFVGDSSMQEAERIRATVGARGAAAQTMSNARLANATDIARVNEEGAQRRFDITGRDATEGRKIASDSAGRLFTIATDDAGRTFTVKNTGANDRFSLALTDAAARGDAAKTAAAQRQQYFDRDLGRSMEATLRPVAIGKDQLSLIEVPSQIGWGGVQRGQQALNWFTSNATPPASGTFNWRPDTTGSDMARFGGGLVSGAFSGAGTDWLQRWRNGGSGSNNGNAVTAAADYQTGG